MTQDGSLYFVYGDGQGIAAKSSSNMTSWSDESTGVFTTTPSWIATAVPGFTGYFWAPDVAYFNGSYHLYYAASDWGTIDSAIGVATSPTLNPSSSNYGFVDQGKVVQSNANAGPNVYTTGFNAIDPSVLVATNGNVWMSFGSYSSGILVTQLDPTTGKRLNTNSLSATLVSNNGGGGWGSSEEASDLVQHGSYYYLFVNEGGCCSGVDSTYNIIMGRSTSPTGPFLDKNGVNMVNGGGTMFLADNGKFIGPGQFGDFTDSGGQDWFSYHYYNGDAVGPTLAIQKLYWTSDGWPSAQAVNPDWSGSSSGNWSQSGNWYLGAVPNGAGAVANFGAPRRRHEIDNTRYLRDGEHGQLRPWQPQFHDPERRLYAGLASRQQWQQPDH